MSRDLASGDYMDGGTTANLAQTNAMTIAVMVNLDAVGSQQSLIARIIDTATNGWRIDVMADGTMLYKLEESDNAAGTATTAVSASTWYGLAVVTSGVDGAGSARFIRYTAATGATATENIGFFNAPSPAGTFKFTIGGRWQGGAITGSAPGLYARCGVWSGVSLSDADVVSWFRYQSTPAGGDGLWTLAGTASPEPDASANAYNLTLSGTAQGADPPIVLPFSRPLRPRPLI
jgi:hypothetical protein